MAYPNVSFDRKCSKVSTTSWKDFIGTAGPSRVINEMPNRI